MDGGVVRLLRTNKDYKEIDIVKVSEDKEQEIANRKTNNYSALIFFTPPQASNNPSLHVNFVCFGLCNPFVRMSAGFSSVRTYEIEIVLSFILSQIK